MMKQNLVLILMGPPGCGKGTQGSHVAEKLKIPKISTGDLLRDEMKSQTSLGQKLRSVIGQGKLIDDQIVLKLLKKKISNRICAEGFILDGFPRTIGQAEVLEVILGDLKKLFKYAAIDIAVSDQEIINRIANRYYCTKCKTSYNRLYNNPKNEDICDVCGVKNKFAVRSDDTKKAVGRRLKEYHDKTAPVISYYDKQGVLFSINGDKSINEVTREINVVLKKILTC